VIRALVVVTALLWAALAHAEVLGGRPAGCPYQFCGCGVSLAVFGRIIPALNLARNWLRFPRTFAAPGMVAVRAHHVMRLVAPGRKPGTWVVYDPNGGHHLTWRHERSIAGYAIVNPRG
jgi:hypothetical protein